MRTLRISRADPPRRLLRALPSMLGIGQKLRALKGSACLISGINMERMTAAPTLGWHRLSISSCSTRCGSPTGRGCVSEPSSCELAFSSKASLLELATPGAALSCRRLTEPGTVTTQARPRQRPHPQRPMLTTRCRSLCQPEFNLSCAAPPLQGARHLLYCIPRFPLGWPARRRPPHLLGPMTRGYGSLQPGIVSRASAEQVNRDRKVCYPGTRVPLADSFRCRPNPRPLVQRWRSL